MARAYAFNLAGALGRISRHAEGAMIAQIVLAIEASDYVSLEKIQRKMEMLLRSAEPEAAMSCVLLLYRNLTDTGRNAESIAILEAFLGIEREHYRDRSLLKARLQASPEILRREPSLGLSFVLGLLGSLLAIERFSDALELLAADADLDGSASLDPEGWAAGLRKRSEDFQPHVSTGYLTMAGLVLAGAGWPQVASVLLESGTPFSTVDWEDPEDVAAGLEELLEAAPSIRTGYVISIALALTRTQGEERAALLVDVYLRRFASLDKDFLLSEFSFLVEQWFLWWGRDADRQPVEMCQMLLPYLRHSLSEHGITLEDRERAIRNVAGLRLMILQTGLYWATQEPDSEKADDLRRTVLLWDLELAQRLLVERFLLNEIRAVPAGEPPVINAWPLPDQEQPLALGYLPETGEVLAAAGVLGKAGFL